MMVQKETSFLNRTGDRMLAYTVHRSLERQVHLRLLAFLDQVWQDTTKEIRSIGRVPRQHPKGFIAWSPWSPEREFPAKGFLDFPQSAGIGVPDVYTPMPTSMTGNTPSLNARLVPYSGMPRNGDAALTIEKPRNVAG